MQAMLLLSLPRSCCIPLAAVFWGNGDVAPSWNLVPSAPEAEPMCTAMGGNPQTAPRTLAQPLSPHTSGS